jgi:hypothetical protein
VLTGQGQGNSDNSGQSRTFQYETVASCGQRKAKIAHCLPPKSEGIAEKQGNSQGNSHITKRKAGLLR